MRVSKFFLVVVLWIGVPCILPGAATLIPPDLTVAQNLQTDASIRLSQPAPADGVDVRIESKDPARLLFATSEQARGSASITLRVPAGRVSTAEFYVHGLANSGEGEYTLSVPGEPSVTGKVKFAASAIVLAGPAKLGNPIITTSGSGPSLVNVYCVQLDESGGVVRTQQLRGGTSITLRLSSSGPKVAALEPSELNIKGGDFKGITQFVPLAAGTTILSVAAPPGFQANAKSSTLSATVSVPGLGLTDHITIGRDLQTRGSLLLGEHAPAGGVVATVTSSDPSRLLLARSPEEIGSKTLVINLAAGETSQQFFLQALGESGTVTYQATAPGYRDRTATVTLAPSGFVLTGPEGPPDEAEILRPNDPVGPHGLISRLGDTTPAIARIYSVYLDPQTRRGADITVQPIRAGVSATLTLNNSNPAIGKASTAVTLKGGLDQAEAEFRPLSLGSTELSLNTPAGFVQPSNATTLHVVVVP